MLAFVAVAMVSTMVAAFTARTLSKSSVKTYFEQFQGPRLTNGSSTGRSTLKASPTSQGTFNSINKGFFMAGGIAVVLGVGMSFLLAFLVAKPVRELTNAAHGISCGDYTKRVRSRYGGAELDKLADTFNLLAEGLETNEELRRNMVADISHELRNPLATIQAQVEAMQDGIVEVDGAALASLNEDVAVLFRLVDDLQQLSLVESGQLELSRLPVDMKEILEGVASRFAASAAAADVVIELEVGERLPPAHADPVRLSQVLGNLVKNALNHTTAGGSVTLSMRRVSDMLEVAVADTGSGIDPDDLPYIFERFYRAEPARERATGGAGIGLSVAKSLIEAHGGVISATSVPGEGTTVAFTVPVWTEEVSWPRNVYTRSRTIE